MCNYCNDASKATAWPRFGSKVGRSPEACLPRQTLELGASLLRRHPQVLALVPEDPAEDLPARALGDRLDEDHAAREPLVL